MSNSLFREEAIRHAGQGLAGEPGLDPMRPLLRIALAFITVLAALATLVGNGEFSRKHTATGRIDEITTDTLVARRFGHLAELNVAEGDTVTEGQPLGRILADRTDPAIELELAGQMTMLREMSASISTGLKQTRHSTATLDRQIRQQMSLARRDIELQREKVAELETQMKRIRGLHHRGYLSSLDYLRFKQGLIGEQQALNTIRQSLGRLAEHRLTLRQSLDEKEQAVKHRLTEISLRQSELRRALSSMENENGRDIVSTADGQVVRIEVIRGGNLVPGQPILHLARPGNPLTGTLLLPSTAVGRIEIGQKLQLSFDAYPPDQFGKVDATITGVTSPKAHEGNTQFVVRVDIRPPAPDLNLVPGMAFTTHVTSERKSLVGWLLKPLNRLQALST